jgi:cytochrome c-type biogenesis protein CcmH/NrfG
LPGGASNGEEWDHLGDVRFRMGNRTEAIEAWQTALKFLQGGRSEQNRRQDIQTKLRQVQN